MFGACYAKNNDVIYLDFVVAMPCGGTFVQPLEQGEWTFIYV